MSQDGLVLCQRAAHGRRLLLDTADRFDAWTTGREAPESYQDGQGLLIVYDGEGTLPSVTVNGPDGEIEFVGAEEIHAVTAAMRCADKLAQAFGPRIPLLQWRRAHV